MQAYCQSVFSSLPVLDTKRLRLRPLSMRDEKDMYRYASDPVVSRHVLWDAHESPRDTRSAEVGYSLARDCWNQGYATEALAAVLRFGFDTLRLNRIEAQHETSNPASGRVMQKCGMTYEGTLRSRVFNKGHFSDVRLYAILRSDPLPPGNDPL